jgi:hypothetical protein
VGGDLLAGDLVVLNHFGGVGDGLKSKFRRSGGGGGGGGGCIGGEFERCSKIGEARGQKGRSGCDSAGPAPKFSR